VGKKARRIPETSARHLQLEISLCFNMIYRKIFTQFEAYSIYERFSLGQILAVEPINSPVFLASLAIDVQRLV
jgi:hypothetical protein